MIYLDRNSVPAPAILGSDRVAEQLRIDAAFFKKSLRVRRQEKYKADSGLYQSHQVSQALKKLSHGKCAYCERRIDAGTPVVTEHYRPKLGAVGLKRDYAPDHYWWLAYEWTNLYAACNTCNYHKGTKFPIEGPRAPMLATPEQLARENRLLLDPCTDTPSQHLLFNDAGEVQGLSPAGKVTVSVLNLNRETLVEERGALLKTVIQPALKSIHAWIVHHRISLEIASLSAGDFHKVVTAFAAIVRSQDRKNTALVTAARRLLNAFRPDQPYQAACRQQLLRWLGSSPRYAKILAALQGTQNQQIDRELSTTKVLGNQSRKIATRRVLSITLQNFRGIANLHIDCNPGRPNAAPWTMLLGENSTGKSSILQGVALALMGKARRTKLGISAASVLRQGTDQGFVKLKLSAAPREVLLQFTKRGFTCREEEPNVLLLGYGATRLLPRPPRSRTPRGAGHVRVHNLFDPFVPLTDAKKWLGKLELASFDYTARAIKEVLSLSHEVRLVRSKKTDDGVSARIHGKNIPLSSLSDGYQSIIGLVADLIKGLHATQTGALDVAEGVVLLDEIGAHLHPRWRLQIVASLRRAFPRVQFLTSTHDPLCLRGLGATEVTVLRRNERGKVYTVTDLPPTESMTAEALLTSEFFGLFSTLDAKIEIEFGRYYTLLALTRPTPAERRELGKLRDKLGNQKFLGTSLRERLLLRIIDRYLALSPHEPQSSAKEKLSSIIEEELRKPNTPFAIER